MFIEIRGNVYNMLKYSKVTRDLIEFGNQSNRILFWNHQVPVEYLDFLEDRVALDEAYDFIKTSTSTVTLVE